MAKESKSKAAKETPAPPSGEVFPFQAEMQQLLHIIINSLYSEREIFLRELISNASDALNTLRFEMLTKPEVRDKETPLEITLTEEAEKKVLTVSDTGMGMSREELIQNLGTIARSGTLDFMKELSLSDPAKRKELIGQFGVGFYSVFMVARRVVVDTCPADPKEAAWQWISEGMGEFSLLPSERKTRGTSIRVELKDGSEEFTQPFRVEEIVRKYSNFVSHPIRMEGRQLNAQNAIWSQNKTEVTREQYNEFYRFITHDLEEPLHVMHLSIDAPVQYRALLFLPKQLTNEVLYSPTAFGLQLHANKVLIQRESQELLPIYLRFLRGVVDTEDLPLNVSRETVQRNPLVARLRTSLTGRVLRELKSFSESNAEKYREFWLQYGRVLKEGLTGDPENRERLLELVRFNSSIGADENDLTTLKDYVSRMREGQKEILYFNGPSREAIERNAHLEFFRRNGLEVLYMYDQVDNFVMTHIQEYDGKKFAAIDQADLEAVKAESDLPAGGAPALEEAALEGVLGFFKEKLGEQVTAVNASKRLVESPACLVNPETMPGNVQRVMRMLDKDFQGVPKILEINPSHSLIHNMARMLAADRDTPMLADLVEQVFANCLLVEGMIEHPEQMVDRIQSLMIRAAELQAGPLPEAKTSS